MKRFDSLARASGGLVGLLLLLAILIAANVIVSHANLRADLTEEKLYSLSDGTRSVLQKLEQPVTLKLYFSAGSAEIPVYLKNYARQVGDLLEEYRIAGDGKLVVEQHDPKPDSDAEEWAQRYGITGQQVGMAGPMLYLGLVAVVGENEAALPFLDPRTQGLLEYSITRLIYNVGNPSKPVVGVMSSLPVLGTAARPYPMPGQAPQASPAWVAFSELRQDYEIREVSTMAEDIDKDLEALVVLHPKNLPETTLYAIDQYLLGGGRLLVFLDPLSVADAEASPQNPYAPPATSSDLERMLPAWGVGYDPQRVLADIKSASRVSGGGGRVEDNPVWLTVRADQINREDVLTSRLELLMLPFAGAFSDQTTDEVEYTALITSSDSAGMVGAMSAQYGAQAIRQDFKEEPLPVHIAVRLKGNFHTAFPGGAPTPEGDQEDEAPPAAQAGLKEGESSIVLVADTDLLVDRFCVQEVNFFGFTAHQPLNDNLVLLANAVEQVAGSSDLIGIRSRGTFNRPFDRVL
ncbi:MAG: GldG family protein, partial [Lentisphaerae bacterium]|nr:GldG family protein [Lentisphaerota bacterium]